MHTIARSQTNRIETPQSLQGWANTDCKAIALTDALTRIEHTVLRPLTAELSDLRYAGDNTFTINGARHVFSDPAWSQTCSYLGLPSDLLPRLGKGLGAVVFRALNNAGNPAARSIRLGLNSENVVVSVGRDKVNTLTNREIVAAVQEAWPARISSETVSVTAFDLNDTEFEIACSTDYLTNEPRPGDILRGGISIRHSQAGNAPTQVLGYIYRLVCSNGLTQRVCLHGRPSRTKRCRADQGPEKAMASIRRQVAIAWEQVEKRMEGFRDLLNHPLDLNALPESLRRRWSINRKLASEIAEAMQHDELGRTHTEYDLVNALSRVATHNLDLAPRYRRHLSLAAGMFAQRHIHRCPTCGNWSEVAVSPQAGSDHADADDTDGEA